MLSYGVVSARGRLRQGHDALGCCSWSAGRPAQVPHCVTPAPSVADWRQQINQEIRESDRRLGGWAEMGPERVAVGSRRVSVYEGAFGEKWGLSGKTAQGIRAVMAMGAGRAAPSRGMRGNSRLESLVAQAGAAGHGVWRSSLPAISSWLRELNSSARSGSPTKRRISWRTAWRSLSAACQSRPSGAIAWEKRTWA